MPTVRRTSSITSLSWIPSEAVEGSQRLAFDAGMAHYDEPLPDAIEDLEELRDADGVRLAEYGPGALLGERAALEDGRRTSTLVAVTPCRVAGVEVRELDRGALQELSKDHRRAQPDPRS